MFSWKPWMAAAGVILLKAVSFAFLFSTYSDKEVKDLVCGDENSEDTPAEKLTSLPK